MQTLSKLLSLLTAFGLAASALANPLPRSSPATLKSICDLSHNDISRSIPSNINDGQATPLAAPIADHPTFVLLSVGVANYTCTDDGTWLVYGAMMELFDISCVPQSERPAFDTAVYNLYASAPADFTATELVESAGLAYKPFALGQHYWVPNPQNSSDPLDGTVNPKWDFGSKAWHDSLENAADPETAYLIGVRTGIVPAPNDPDVNIPWATLSPYFNPDGSRLGTFADQVFRINTNGGYAPNASCVPGGPIFQAKCTVEFWYYGGHWAN